jgi:hypothetical protein
MGGALRSPGLIWQSGRHRGLVKLDGFEHYQLQTTRAQVARLTCAVGTIPRSPTISIPDCQDSPGFHAFTACPTSQLWPIGSAHVSVFRPHGCTAGTVSISSPFAMSVLCTLSRSSTQIESWNRRLQYLAVDARSIWDLDGRRDVPNQKVSSWIAVEIPQAPFSPPRTFGKGQCWTSSPWQWPRIVSQEYVARQSASSSNRPPKLTRLHNRTSRLRRSRHGRQRGDHGGH